MNEFDTLVENMLSDLEEGGLWDNIRARKGKLSKKWKTDPEYRKQIKKQAKKIAAEDNKEHEPMNPGILKNQIKGKVTCTKARSLKSKTKDKGSKTAKAAQRFLNYHCD